MTSKCGKDKNMAHEGIAGCVTDVLTIVSRLLRSITEQTCGNTEPAYFIGDSDFFSLSNARVTTSSFSE